MKIHAVQHVPAFVETDVDNRADVNSLDELLAVPWIARWGHDDLVAKPGEPPRIRPFHQWSLSTGGGGRPRLMAEYDNGDYFWVVAYVTSDEPIPLPEWQETEKARIRRERWNSGDWTA